MTGIREARQQVRELTADLRVFNRVVATSKVQAQDLLVLLQTLGLPPDARQAVVQLQVTIATINTLRTTLKLLQIEMGPLGWLLLGIGVFGGMAATQEMEARRPRY